MMVVACTYTVKLHYCAVQVVERCRGPRNRPLGCSHPPCLKSRRAQAASAASPDERPSPGKEFFFSWNTTGRADRARTLVIVSIRCRSRMRRDPGFPAFICSRARPESATQRGENAAAGSEPRAARCLARYPAHFSTGGSGGYCSRGTRASNGARARYGKQVQE